MTEPMPPFHTPEFAAWAARRDAEWAEGDRRRRKIDEDHPEGCRLSIQASEVLQPIWVREGADMIRAVHLHPASRAHLLAWAEARRSVTGDGLLESDFGLLTVVADPEVLEGVVRYGDRPR